MDDDGEEKDTRGEQEVAVGGDDSTKESSAQQKHIHVCSSCASWCFKKRSFTTLLWQLLLFIYYILLYAFIVLTFNTRKQ